MPTENIKRKREVAREAFDHLFPRTDARVECGDMRRPPADRMMRPDRHITKQALREIAERPEHVRD